MRGGVVAVRVGQSLTSETEGKYVVEPDGSEVDIVKSVDNGLA